MSKETPHVLSRPVAWVGLLLAALLSACAATEPHPHTLALDAKLQVFKEEAPTPDTASRPAASVPDRWWAVFSDPLLDQLVEQADRGNTGIQSAASRLDQARALAGQAGAARQPQLGMGAGVVRQQGPLLNAAGEEGSLFTTAVTLSYEVDVMGRLAQAGDAAALDAQERQALLRGARLLTQTQVVQTYLALRALDADLALLRQSLALQRQSLRIQAHQLQSGTLSELDYEGLQGVATAQTLETQILQQRRAELENALAVLLGRSASEFHLDSPEDGSGADTGRPLPMVRAGLPASVLQRRPDVAAAQKAVLAAQKRLGVTQAAWFPNLSLTATSGFASAELSTLLGASMQTWAFGALTSLPLLDGGRRQAGVAAADAQLGVAMASYHQTVLQALREVEDQLSAQRLLAEQNDAQERVLGSATRASELSAARLRLGSISQLEGLATRRKELQCRRQLMQLRAARFQTTVALVRALGGGWD